MTALALILAIITTTWLALATFGTLAALALVHAAPPEPDRIACVACHQDMRGMTHVDGMWLCLACLDEMPQPAEPEPQPDAASPDDAFDRTMAAVRRIELEGHLQRALGGKPTRGDC